MTVYLVGAGPGDPGLLTVRGRELLGAADVVLYDGLVEARLLDCAPPWCRRVDVGKVSRRLDSAPIMGASGGASSGVSGGVSGEAPAAGGHRAHQPSQEAINSLLVEYGRRYECVVRLKGGDPFVFGRGGEEALALTRAGVPFEVVPGVSAAVAVPAAAGIPVTHRGLAASVAIVTGHEAAGKPDGQAGVDWTRLATAVDTLVILMGVGRLPDIVAALITSGRDPATPAAVIERGTTAGQRVVTGALRDLPPLAAASGVRSPATVIVGNVVALGSQLAQHPRAETLPALPALPALPEVQACA